MISLTVHHHDRQPAAVAPARQPASGGTSNVEVQYLTGRHHYFRPTASTWLHQRSSSSAACLGGARDAPPLARQRKGGCQPSGSSEQRATATVDSNNSCNCNIAAACSLAERAEQQQQREINNNSSGKFEGQTTRLMNDITSAPNQAGELRRGNDVKLHSRSISLVINPEFSSDSETGAESAASLSKRKGLPRPARRTRLLVVDGAQSNLQLQQQAELEQLDLMTVEQSSSSSNCNLSEEDLTAKPSCRAQQQNASSLPPSASSAAAEATFSSFKCCQKENSAPRQPQQQQQQREPLQRTASAGPDNLAQFRQVGAMLRQISDEFLKSRRRTI